MKNVIFLTLFLFCCLQANSQNYFQLANECFDKGDYECAKRNYTFFQTFDGRNIRTQIQNADECMRILNLADDYFKEKEREKAKERYQIVLEKNQKNRMQKTIFVAAVGSPMRSVRAFRFATTGTPVTGTETLTSALSAVQIRFVESKQVR